MMLSPTVLISTPLKSASSVMLPSMPPTPSMVSTSPVMNTNIDMVSSLLCEDFFGEYVLLNQVVAEIQCHGGHCDSDDALLPVEALAVLHQLFKAFRSGKEARLRDWVFNDIVHGSLLVNMSILYCQLRQLSTGLQSLNSLFWHVPWP